jgi:hypothetical protein
MKMLQGFPGPTRLQVAACQRPLARTFAPSSPAAGAIPENRPRFDGTGTPAKLRRTRRGHGRRLRPCHGCALADDSPDRIHTPSPTDPQQGECRSALRSCRRGRRHNRRASIRQRLRDRDNERKVRCARAMRGFNWCNWARRTVQNSTVRWETSAATSAQFK